MDDRQERLTAFLVELSALSNKYHLKIEGCGCHGSPYIEETEFPGAYQVDMLDENLKFVPKGAADEG